MSPIERHVTQALGKVQPGAAVDFATIMALITQIFTFIQQCPFGRAKAAIRAGSVEAKAAAYLAVKRSGYGGNAVDLTQALLDQGCAATDAELDETIASALSLPGLTRIAGVVALCLIYATAGLAGPFPARPPASESTGPFPTGSESSSTPAPWVARLDAGESKRDAPSAARMQDVPSPLRQRIADYVEAGGGIVGVRDMTITTHMLRDHGWTAAQLEGLTEDELFSLHGMQHAGLIEPADAALPLIKHSGRTYPVHVDGDSAYWFVDGVRWSNLGGGRPVEGQVFTGGGRRFVYRDGRMHEQTGL